MYDDHLQSFVNDIIITNKSTDNIVYTIANKSDQELFEEMILSKYKLQHFLNMKRNSEYYKQCSFSHTIDDFELLDDVSLIKEARKYNFYYLALESRDIKENDEHLQKICIFCDTENDKEADECAVCLGELAYRNEGTERRLLRNETTNQNMKHSPMADDNVCSDQSSLDNNDDTNDHKEDARGMEDHISPGSINGINTEYNNEEEELQFDCCHYGDNAIVDGNSAAKKLKCESIVDLSNSWPCEECTFINRNGVDSCEACTHNRYLPIDDYPFTLSSCMPSWRNLPFFKSDMVKQFLWQCNKCQCLNNANQMNCQSCQENISRHCKWRCIKCTYLNDISSSKCCACDNNNEVMTEIAALVKVGNGQNYNCLLM